MKIESELDQFIPRMVVEHAVFTFLDEAEWRLEFGKHIIEIPRTPPPMLISRALVVAHAPDVFLGDHFEAVFALHPESGVAGSILARAGYLKLYFDRSGQFISEDRYPPHTFLPNCALLHDPVGSPQLRLCCMKQARWFFGMPPVP